MLQPRQGIIDALRREGRQMQRPVRHWPCHAVHDVVVHGVQVRHVENVAQAEIQHPFLGHRQVALGGDGEMHRHGRVADAHRDRHAVVADQQAYLFAQVIAEQVGPGDSGRIAAGCDHMAKGQARIDRRMGRHGQAQFGIIGAIPGGGLVALQCLGEAVQQKARRLRIKILQLRDGGTGIGELPAARRLGAFDRQVTGIRVHSCYPSFP